MRFYFLLLLFCNGFLVLSQGTEELVQDFENGTVDQKIEILFGNYSELESINKDSILYFIKDLQSMGIDQGREDAIALSNYYFGHFLNDNGLLTEARGKLTDALKFYRFQENDTMLAVAYNAIGNTEYLEGNYGGAEENYLKSYEYGKKAGYERFKSLSSANLSRIYIYQEKYEKAKDILDDYIDFNKSISNFRNAGAGYGLIGQLYLNQNKFDKATQYLERSMEFNLSTGNAKLIGNGYTNIAIASFIKEDFKRAEEYFQLALSYRLEGGDGFFIAESYFNLGDFYFEINELDSAIFFYDKSFDVAFENDNKIGMVDALGQMAKTYEAKEDYKKQAESLQEYIKLQDEIHSEKLSNELSILRISFEEDLKKQSFMGNKREEKLRSQIEEVSTVWDYWVWIVLIGLLTLSGIVYFSINKRRK